MVTTSIRRWSALAACAAIFIITFSGALAATQTKAPTYSLDIPAQDLNAALQALALASHHKLFYRSELVEGKFSAALKGEYTADEAISTLLLGTGLVFDITPSAVVLIREKGTPSASALGATRTLDSGVDTAALRPVNLAMAQEGTSNRTSSNTEQSTASEQEVVVIGKPTRNVDMKRGVNDALPFQIITRNDIERQGYQNTAQLVKSFTANTSITNFEGGSATGSNQGGKVEINIRGLGISNTLILVNGRRMAANMPYSAQGDVGTIPLSAIDQVEMLSSGASAIYGSSAVGGVINFILRKEYEGSQLDATYANVVETDAANRKLSFVTGYSTSTKRNSFTLYGDWSDQNAMNLGDRGMAARFRNRILETRPSLLIGQSSPPSGTRGNIRSASGAPLGIPGNPTAIYASVPAGYNGTGGLAAFNSTAGTYSLGTDYAGEGGDRFSLLDSGHSVAVGLNTYHRINSTFNIFTELSWSDREQGGPFVSHYWNAFYVPSTNAFNPFGQDIFVTTTPTDTGNPEYVANYRDYRAVAGLEGTLTRAWRYVFDSTYQHHDLPSVYANAPVGYYFNPDILGSSNPAVAYNPLLDFSSGQRNSQAAINALQLNERDEYHHYMLQNALRFFGNVDLFERRIDVAAGAEHRKEAFYRAAYGYYLASTGEELAFFQNSQGDKTRNVLSLYAEAKFTLLGHDSAPGAQRLDLDLAVRREDFSDFGATTNPIVALRYQPIESLALRGSWGTGFVAPSLVDIDYNTFSPYAGTVVSDPKRNNESVTVISDGSLRRNVEPEKADSVSLGLVLSPPSVPGLRFSVDWFSVSKKDNIRFQGGQNIVDNEDYFPGLVVRGAPSGGFSVGPITRVFAGMLNATKAEVQAFDVGSDYAFDTGIGQISLHAAATIVTRYDIQLAPNAPLQDYIDRPLALRGSPVKFKANFGLGWERGPLGTNINVQHIGKYDARAGFEDIQGSSSIDASQVVGLQLNYDFDKTGMKNNGWLQSTQVVLGVDNLFDELPPLVAGLPETLGYSEFTPVRGTSYYLTIRKGFGK